VNNVFAHDHDWQPSAARPYKYSNLPGPVHERLMLWA
jgi:hypothetical protein